MEDEIFGEAKWNVMTSRGADSREIIRIVGKCKIAGALKGISANVELVLAFSPKVNISLYHGVLVPEYVLSSANDRKARNE